MSFTVLRVTTACLQTVNVIHCFEGHNCMFANSECHSLFAKHADGTLENFFNRLTTPLIWATAIAIMAKECLQIASVENIQHVQKLFSSNLFHISIFLLIY